MRKAIILLSILTLSFASVVGAQETTDEADETQAASGSSEGYQDLIPLPKLYLSERQPYLERYFSIEPSLFAGGYLFSPGQIYQNTWWVGGRVGVLLFWGLEAELNLAWSRVKIDSNRAKDAEFTPDKVDNLSDYMTDVENGRDFLAWNFNALWHPIEWPLWQSGWGTMAPFVRGGFGGIIQHPPIVYNTKDKKMQGGGIDRDPTFGLGAGVKYLFPWWDFAGLRFDMYYSLMAGFGETAFDNESQAGGINSEFTLGVFGNIDWWGILYPPDKKPEGPVDSDGDGLVDSKDKCPDEIGPPSNDGCPIVKTVETKVEDRDKDGIPDAEDKCPDKAGLADLDGCPDTDGDGITDADDKCPKKAGDKKFGGCPDTDGDGIPDDKDKCPTVAEDKNGYQDEDGCPEGGKEEEEKQKIIKQFSGTLEGIKFITGKATLTKGSKKILDNIAAKLKPYPDVKIEIDGHTDSKGSAKANKRLSRRRAESVRTYLISKGLKAGNLKAIGYGEEKPVADNKTKAGRAQNRRIEFKITK